MAGGSLFHPDNRMLNGFAHDFSLFGGQPDPAFTVGPPSASSVAPGTTAASHDAADQPAIDPVSPGGNALPVPDAGADREVGDEASIGFAASVGQHQVSHETTVGADVAIQAPASGSSTAPDVIASLTPHPEATSPQGHAMAPPAIDGQTALVADQVGEGIIPVLGSLTGEGFALAGFVTDHLGAGVVGQAGGLVSSLVAGTHDVVAATLNGSGFALNDVAATGDGLLHGFGDIGGGDPAGGIATLVGMVNTVDQFAVSAAAPAHTIDPAGSIVDDLIGGNDGSALLGGVDAHLDPTHLAHTDHTVDHVLGGL